MVSDFTARSRCTTDQCGFVLGLQCTGGTPGALRKAALCPRVAAVPVRSTALTWALLPPDSGLEVLAVQRVSKTQAWQRTGRAGREDSGVCYRLYTEDEFEKFDKMTVPEIQR